MLIFDSHLDLSMNALEWNRDLKRRTPEIRADEQGMTEPGRAWNTVAFPEMRKGKVAVSLATVLARVERQGNPLPGFKAPEIAYGLAQGELAYYRALEELGVLRVIENSAELLSHIKLWESCTDSEALPLGVIFAAEGADPIMTPQQLERWWNQGLRVIGMTHYGEGTYAHGTSSPGGIKESGKELLKEMERLGVVLDVTHLSDQSFWEALELYSGPVLASHNNCRALVPDERQFSDEQVDALIGRGGVIGVALDAWMLYPEWIKGETKNTVVSLEAVADHIDHICQRAGNAKHAAIGSDLDGAYGGEQTPHDLDTIADLQKIGALLQKRGYSKTDIEGVMYKNWLNFFVRAWERN